MAEPRASLLLLIEAFDQLRHYGDEPVELEGTDLSTLPLAELEQLRTELLDWKRAAAEIVRQVDNRIKVDLRKGGYAVFGRTYYRVKDKTDLKLRPDRASAWWELVETSDFARRLFNPNDARITGIRELAELIDSAVADDDPFVDPETGEIQNFMQFFYEESGDDEDSDLEVKPVYKAAQWVQKLADGTIHRPEREET